MVNQTLLTHGLNIHTCIWGGTHTPIPLTCMKHTKDACRLFQSVCLISFDMKSKKSSKHI